MGNNVSCKVIGIGTIKMKLEDGTSKILTGVRHVPELKRNLISPGTLDQQGYVFKGEGGVLKVTKGSMMTMKGLKNNGLYTLQGKTCDSSAGLISQKNIDTTRLSI